MRIEIHPKPDGMHHVNLMFSEADPQPEDAGVRDILERFQVPPKRTLEWERDGRMYEVLQYGQCVIDAVMYDIEKHQAVAQRVLAMCGEETAGAAVDEARARALAGEIARELHRDAGYTYDEHGGATLRLDEDDLRARLRERLLAFA